MKSGDNPSPSASIVHKLKLEALRPGDIILTRSPGQSISDLIRIVTASDYSHAILVLNPPWAIESAKYGVVKFQIDRLAALSPENIQVLRLRNDLQEKLDVPALIRYVETQVTTPYAHIEVLASMFQSWSKKENGAFFCSQLVAEAYKEAGVGLIEKLQPERVTPAVISASSMFQLVTGCTYECASDNLPFEHVYFFDSSSPTSFAEQENEKKQKIVQIIRPEFSKVGVPVTTFNDSVLALVKTWTKDPATGVSLDQMFAQVILQNQLVGLPNKVMPPDSESFFTDFYLVSALTKDDISETKKYEFLQHYELMNERLKISNAERDRDLTTFRNAYLDSGLETIRLVLAVTTSAFNISMQITQTNARCLAIMRKALGFNSSDI